MKAESKYRWLFLEKFLLRDWWKHELACRIFTGCVHIDQWGEYVADSGELRIFDLNWEPNQEWFDSEPMFGGSLLTAKRKDREWRQLLVLWKFSTHDRSSSNLRNEDEWNKEYCIRWALSKKINIPWLEWAIEYGYLPANISGDVDIPRVNLKGKDEESGQIKTDNLLRLMSILVEMMVDPNKKKNFTNQTALKEYIAEHYEPHEERNKGLSKDSLNRTFSDMNKARKPNKIAPDD